MQDVSGSGDVIGKSCYPPSMVDTGWMAARLAVSLLLTAPSLNAVEDKKESLWDKSVNLSGAFGFKDNILLSKVQNDQSAFWQGDAELTVFRLPADGTTVSLFATFEDRRYFSASVNKEENALANATVSHSFGSRWETGLELQYSYLDQVLDASVTDFEAASLLVRAHIFSATPFVTRHLAFDTWAKLEFLTERDLYAFPLDDYWEYGPKLTFGKNFGHGSVASLSYWYHRRPSDTREERNLDFSPIPGTILEFQQHEVEGQLRMNWDKKKRWRSRFRLGWRSNEDNGPGFYDYNRLRVAKRLEYRATSWSLSLEGKVLHYDYAVKPVSIGEGIVNRWNYLVGLRMEKQIRKQVKIFAESEHEWNVSNERLDQYEVNTVMGGVDWEF